MADTSTVLDPGVVLRAAGVDLVAAGRLLHDQVTSAVRAGEHWAVLIARALMAEPLVLRAQALLAARRA